MEQVSNDLNGRILHVKIFYNSEILNITNIYAPSGKSNRTQNHRFFEKLYPYIPQHHPAILAGDFNCVENPQLDKYPPVKTYSKPLTLLDLTQNYTSLTLFEPKTPPALPSHGTPLIPTHVWTVSIQTIYVTLKTTSSSLPPFQTTI